MQRRSAVSADRSVPGIFDTIALAMSAVLAQPMLLIVPALLDAYLWLGARLSAQALIDPLARWLDRRAGADGRALAEGLSEMVWTQDLITLVGLFVPSILSVLERDQVAEGWTRTTVRPDDPWLVVLVSMALLILGPGVGMLFRVPLAYTLRGMSPSVTGVARATVVAWLRYLGFLALACGLFALVTGPALVVGALFLVVGVNLVPLLALLLAVPAVWAVIFLAFAREAIVMSEVGPIRAGYLSFHVVRRNFWQTVGFGLVVLLISLGLPLVWARVVGNVPGVVLAVLGNAFVATGLALAQLRFFTDRLRRWRVDLAPAPIPAA